MSDMSNERKVMHDWVEEQGEALIAAQIRGEAICGNCRHWKDFEPEIGDERDAMRVGQCNKAYFNDYSGPELSDWMMSVVDGSGYYAALKTRASMGCSLWEIKPKSTEMIAPPQPQADRR